MPDALMLWVVKSMYLDEAVPRGPLLQWMMLMLTGVKLNHRQLRNCIDAAPGVYADPAESKKLNFTAVLRVPPAGFTKFTSENDINAAILGEDAWSEVTKFLARGGWPKPEDVSHKYYVVASWLQDSSDRLRAMSFGRVLSIVRSGLSVAGLLGHRSGLLVPYAHSEECERRVNACTGQPTHVAPDESYVKTWDELIDILNKLIRSQPDGQLEVCKMKSLIRSTYKTELSETVFGHQSLSKLLADPQLGDDFLLGSTGNRYTLATKRASTSPFTMGDVTDSWPVPSSGQLAKADEREVVAKDKFAKAKAKPKTKPKAKTTPTKVNNSVAAAQGGAVPLSLENQVV
jgi:hypothetical protein